MVKSAKEIVHMKKLLIMLCMILSIACMAASGYPENNPETFAV